MRTTADGRRILLAVTSAQSLKLMRGFPEFLASQGWEVHVAVSSPPQNYYPADSGVVLHDLTMTRDPSPVADIVALWRWTRVLRRVRPGVVMAGTPKAGLFGMVAAAVTRVPRRIYVLRGLRLETVRGTGARVLWGVEWLTARCSHQVLAVSPSLRDEFCRRGLSHRSKVRVLGAGSSNGVITQVSPSASAVAVLREGSPLTAGNLVVGFVGRVSPDKGVPTLVEALRLLVAAGARVGVLLVGPEEPAGFLATTLRDAGVPPDRIWYVGPVDDPTPYYALMDVLCLPTRREGFPNVVLEAAVQGVPAVVSDVTGARDAVRPGRTGLLFPVANADVLAERLRALSLDVSAVRRMGADARRLAEREFERSRVWGRQLAFLESPPTPTNQSECE